MPHVDCTAGSTSGRRRLCQIRRNGPLQIYYYYIQTHRLQTDVSFVNRGGEHSHLHLNVHNRERWKSRRTLLLADRQGTGCKRCDGTHCSGASARPASSKKRRARTYVSTCCNFNMYKSSCVCPSLPLLHLFATRAVSTGSQPASQPGGKQARKVGQKVGRSGWFRGVCLDLETFYLLVSRLLGGGGTLPLARRRSVAYSFRSGQTDGMPTGWEGLCYVAKGRIRASNKKT